MLSSNIDKHIYKNDVEIGLEFGDGKRAKKFAVCGVLAAGAVPPGTKNSGIPERIRREPDL